MSYVDYWFIVTVDFLRSFLSGRIPNKTDLRALISSFSCLGYVRRNETHSKIDYAYEEMKQIQATWIPDVFHFFRAQKVRMKQLNLSNLFLDLSIYSFFVLWWTIVIYINLGIWSCGFHENTMLILVTYLKCGMQLSFFLIDQKSSVCIDGKKFLIQNLLKDLGHKRWKLCPFLLYKFSYNFIQLISPLGLQEDDKIVELVTKYGPTKWSLIAQSLPGRIGKQCRER